MRYRIIFYMPNENIERSFVETDEPTGTIVNFYMKKLKLKYKKVELKKIEKF